MSKQTPFLLAALSILSCAQFAQARNVFILPPGDGSFRPVANFVGDPFSPASVPTISAAADTFAAFASSSGNKFYFVGRSSTDTVVVTDSNFQVIARRNLGLGASAAAMTPDGRYLVVAAGTVQVLSTSTDTVVAQVDAGSNPNDVAISLDSTRAFITSNASQRLTSIDLNSFQTAGLLQNLGPVNGVNVGPNGLVYVAAQNILYEVDPRDLSLRGGSGISLNGQPGKPAFAADSTGTIRVLLPNLNTAFGGASALTVDLLTRTATPIFANNVIFERIIPVSGFRAFAVSQSNQLYDINLPGSASFASITGLASSSGIRSIAVSDEFPTARYLYVASNTNTVSRVDLNNNTVSGSFPLSNPPGNMDYAGSSTTGLPTSIFAFNNGQFVQPSAQSLPLVVRVVDSAGKPLQNVPVTFTTTAPGAFIVSGATSNTGANGTAQAVVLAPSTLGSFAVTATAGFGTGVSVTTNFTLTVGTGTAGPTGLVGVRGGNGQVIRETGVTPELLRVIVRDSSGNPVPGAVVTWNVTTANGPNGTLLSTVTITDNFGETTNSYIAPFLGPNLLQSYVQSTITASTFSGSVNMYVTVIPVVFNQNPASLPTVQVVQPTAEALTGQVGTTIPGAIQVRVSAGSGPSAGTAIPNVGISVTTGLDPSFGVSARCSETTGLTDANGFASCDLILGSRIGTAPLTINVGGQSVAQINLTTTPGTPGKVILVQGDGQRGNAGATLPQALVARVEDSFGNALPGAAVTWTVESGSATLLNTINRSDNSARVSTLVRLGNSPGQIRIRVTAQGGSSQATATFTVSVDIAATQIRRVSGDGQSAQVNTAFGEQLVAQVLDANNAPVANVPVTFTVNSGSASLGSPTANSDSNGNVRTSVTAGGTAGSVTISATFAGNSVSWTLTVTPLGPTISASGIVNAASGLNEIAPGSVVTIRGTNIVPSARGYVLPANQIGPRPLSLSGASVAFGGVPAPIFWAANINGQESITVQVPFEAPENAVIPVTVTSNNVSATVNVSIAPAAPGIFENTDDQGRRYAVVTRMDGTFVTPDNPIGRGENARVYVTGLGRVTGVTETNALGAGQRVAANVIVGLNDGGVPLISAEYAEGLLGVYVVTFTVPSGTATGSNRNLAVAVESGGNLVFGNGSTMAVR